LTENQKFCSVLSVGNGRDTPRTWVSISHNVQWKFSELHCSSLQLFLQFIAQIVIS